MSRSPLLRLLIHALAPCCELRRCLLGSVLPSYTPKQGRYQRDTLYAGCLRYL